MKPDSFRWLPLVIASLAIVVSVLSWREAHRGRLINEEINRPILVITELRLERVMEEESKEVHVRPIGPERVGVILTAKVKNIGRSTASILYFDFTPRSKFSETCETTGDIAINWAGPKGPSEILAGSEETIAQPFFLSEGCKQLPTLQFAVLVPIAYIDPGSGKQYFQKLDGKSKFDMTSN